MYKEQNNTRKAKFGTRFGNLGDPSGLPRNASGDQVMSGVLNRMGLNQKQVGKLMPNLMPTRPPIIANKARGTQSSSMYRPMPNALGPSMMF